MPYKLEDLVVTRVDLVDEGANSAAFIELYKRKGPMDTMGIDEIVKSMKPEHATIVTEALSKAKADYDAIVKERDLSATNVATITAKLATATADLEKAKADLKAANASNDVCTCDGEADANGMCKVCGKPKKVKKADKGSSASFDETETLKSMPEAAKAIFLKMRTQKEAAEAAVLKANEKAIEADAINKAASFKALPIAQERLVGILKSATPELMSVLKDVDAAMQTCVLDETGHVTKSSGTKTDAWGKIESAADTIVKRDSVTKSKAITLAIQENPDLYANYLKGEGE